MRMAVNHFLVLLLLQIVLLFWLIKASKLSLCPFICGNVTIWYPFGIGKECYFDKSYEVICDHSYGSPKAFLPSIDRLELLYTDKYAVSIGVSVPVISLNSSDHTSNVAKGVNLSGSPFTFSPSNRFTAIGCDRIYNRDNNSIFGGCLSIYTCDPTVYHRCYDYLCALPPNITQDFSADITYFYSKSIPQKCQSVAIAEEHWVVDKYLSDPHGLKGEEQVPALLKWGEKRGICFEEFNSHSIFCNWNKTDCLKQLSSGHFCLCNNDYYLQRGYCSGDLICNTSSDYNCPTCPDGYNSTPFFDGCYRILNKSRIKYIIIGCSGGLGLFFLLIGVWWLYKFIKRRRKIKLKQQFFKKNGGLLLQKELPSNEGNIEKTKLFTSKDLEKATDNYNVNRILGQGGQGTVYKGMLQDGGIVAVKKSKVEENNVEQFINEVVILSQINHRNIVKLLGCCLETDVPLLVYEFIPNGTLYKYIHDQTEESPLTWEMRLRIAIEVSGALSYLHSAASIPIYHRDIKSTNILLDDKYRAKVSDFGASRSITVDQTHLTTQVQGTFGYLDPEYFRSSQFTEKSDVYSFGVVLVELLTRQKPIRSVDTDEDRSLAGYFLQAIKENRLFEVLDVGVLKEAKKEEIITAVMLAKRCLNLNGKKRPTMKEVAFELAGISTLVGASASQQNCEVIDFMEGDIAGHFETSSSSSGSILNSVAL